jgi:hypothetical protein
MQTFSPARHAARVGVAVLAALVITATPAAAATYNLGNADTLYVFTPAQTAKLDYHLYPKTSGWEGQLCRFLRFTPAKAACTASNTLNAIGKGRMRWFLYEAKLNGACAALIWDYGRHGVNQFKKRWKVRPPEDFENHLDLPFVTPGTYSHVRYTNPSSGYVDVTC